MPSAVTPSPAPSVRSALDGTGVTGMRPVYANLTAPGLVAESLRRHEGRLSADGAIMVNTGVHTGRSVQDKFVVDEPATTAEIWWGKINKKLSPEKFTVLKSRVQAYLQGQTITGSVWSVAPQETGGVRVTGELGGATRTAATLAGGVPGKVYRVANRVTLSDGRTDERSVTLRVEQR